MGIRLQRAEDAPVGGINFIHAFRHRIIYVTPKCVKSEK